MAGWLQQRPPGLVFSIDIGGSTFDSILSSAATFSGNEFVPAWSLLRHHALMVDRGQSINASDMSAVFGKYDGHMLTDKESDYWTNGGVYQTRSIGSWLEGRARANVLHLGDPELLFDHLEGAAPALETQRPILTLYPAGQDRTKLQSLLSWFKYTVVDLSLRPVGKATANSPADFGWIALPNEQEGSAGLSLASDVESDGFDGLAWNRLDYGEALPRQRRSSAVFNIGVSELPRLARTFSASEVLCSSGSYPVEGDGETFWRWLGPGASSQIALPCSLPGSYQVEIAGIGASAAERLALCRVLVEGREVRTSTSRVTEGKLEFIVHLDWAKYTGHIEVTLISFGCRPPTESDPRTLRLCVESVAVSPC
ncbi:MAG TPA: hypothetical protein VKR31_01220 [Rhizomicrobium sp.]|nr:hypothetical protein [Rhizomicrobium sp.]